MNRGILYVATGDDLVNEARVSLSHVRNIMGDVSAGIVVDEGKDPGEFDYVINLSEPEYGFSDKIRGMRKSPFEATLYLDTDTYVCNPVWELFETLEMFDIGAVPNQNRDHYSGTSLGVPQCFPEFNTGVVPFRKSKTDEIFNRWLNESRNGGWGDQPSFRKTIYESEARFISLPQEYNYQLIRPAHLSKDIKIGHGRLIDIDTMGARKDIDIERKVSEINRSDGHRMMLNGGFKTGPDPPMYYRLNRSLRKRGIIATLTSAVNILRRL